MRTRHSLLLFGVLVCGLFTLQPNVYAQEEVLSLIPQASSPLEEYFENHDSVAGEKISPQTKLFYEENNYVVVWYPKGQMSKAAEIALDTLRHADEEGLNPDDYNIEKIEYSKEGWMDREILLTQTMLKYINDVRVGRLPPSHVARFIKVVSPPTQVVERLTQALQDEDQFHLLRKMGPEIEDYQNLKELLKEYRELYKKYPVMPEVKVKGKGQSIKVGSSHPAILNVKKVLNILGYLESYKPNTLYNEDTEEALKEFQKYHNLTIDGKLGPKTIKALNWSIEKRIQKIIVNMERLRWLPDHLGDSFILVNVGGYEVLAVRAGKIEHRIKAIVGKVSRQTPLFYAPLQNIVINPSWGVPHSIFVRDKLQRIIKDPGYLTKAGFTVYDHAGRQMDPHAVNWESEGNSMHLRQSPGAHNALGRIKFGIANLFAIYLHGTPQDKLFGEEERNFSSGCIRLEKPTVLAAWVLEQVNGWGVDEITAKIKEGGTKTVPVNIDLPVYFAYMTVWVDTTDPSGHAHFSPDAYKLDPALIEELGVKI